MERHPGTDIRILFLLLVLLTLGCESTLGERAGDTDSSGDFDYPEPATDGDAEADSLPDGDLERDENADGDADLDDDPPETAESSEFEEAWDSDPDPEPEPELDANGFDYDRLVFDGGIEALAIPDPGTLESPLQVIGDLPVWDLEVHVVIEHDFPPDLSLEMESPQGKIVSLRRANLPSSSDRLDAVTRHADFRGERTEGTWKLRVTDHREGDGGRLLYWRIAFLSGPAFTENDSDPGPDHGGYPLDIPDNDPRGVSAALRVESGPVVEGLCLKIDWRHPFGADLQLDLRSPRGDWAILKETGAPLEAYDGEYRFNSEVFAGQPSEGVWVASVRDLYQGDSGVWRDWRVIFDCYRIQDPDGDLDGEEEFDDELDDDPYAEGDPDSEAESDLETESDLEAETDSSTACLAASVTSFPFETEANTASCPSRLSPPDACAGWSMDGPESVWPVELSAGDRLLARILSPEFDAGLYVLGSLSDEAAFCRGTDRGRVGEDESLEFTASEAGTFYVVADSAAESEFGGFTLRMEKNPADAGGAVHSSTTLPKLITDANPIGVSAVVPIEEFSIANRICAGVEITHPSPRELYVSLRSPDGTIAVLHDHEDGLGGIRKEWSLDTFQGEWTRGNWLLRARDNSRYNVGTIDDFWIDLNCGEADGDQDFDLDPDPDTDCPADVFLNGNWAPEWAVPVNPPMELEDLWACSDIDDWYKFPASASQRISVTARFRDYDGDMDIKLYKEGDYSSYVASSASVTDNESFTYTPTTDGYYYLKVYVLGTGYQVPYTLEISVE